MKRCVVILSMYDLIHHLRQRYELETRTLRDLVELVAYCQIDSVRANGVESIYSSVPAYISPLELIEEDLRVQFSSICSKSLYRRLRLAALDVWHELPTEDRYWPMIADVRDPKFALRWNRTDLMLELS